MPWLKESDARNVTSQFGEDGLIEAVFQRIGIKNKWMFEVGASDGLKYSNSKHLIDQEWDAVLIESDPDCLDLLNTRYLYNSNVRVIGQYVNSTNMDKILGSTAAPHDMDLGVIDINEQDYWVWNGMQRYHPRVMIVEFGKYKPKDQIPECNDVIHAANLQLQAGYDAIRELGIAKGYVVLADTPVNLIFGDTDAVAAA